MTCSGSPADRRCRWSSSWRRPPTSLHSVGRIDDNLAAVQAKIAAACARAGRDPAEVRLLPVSKTQPPEVIEEAYAAGVRLFGENRVQEAVAKAEALAAHPDLGWAMIGHLQTNKAKDVVGFAREFHALDSLKVAAALNRRLHDTSRNLDVFIQVNSSGEPQKYGLPPGRRRAIRPGSGPVRGAAGPRPDDARGLLRRPATRWPRVSSACGTCNASCGESGAPGRFDELSMGMSGDFELAIEYGATTVRVGEAIFGPRH